MSQSDYLAQKKTANILKVKDNVKNLGNVLDSSTLLDFKTYVLSNEVPDTNIRKNQLVPQGKQLVFGMEKPVRGTGHLCPTYGFCQNTLTRPNRSNRTISIDTNQLCNSNIFSHYRSNISKNEYFLGQKREYGFFCFRDCDEYFHNRMGELYLYDRNKWLRRN